ncbi:hypothetical protein [Tepidibacillus fermentans]|uniref:Uncharacterized protein n=1 Tax=Tepidibacillus fermentans TaxID=1281767 RepID=A0A4R3KB74_9BACI|nr:hypothetical protein [Tepidibacillus fermentans]TCS80394.1 hypothetical protein EDD72_11761 [Tepidibacillus fermentans]
MEEMLKKLLDELADMKANMATKSEIQDIKSNMVTKSELQDMKANMATKSEIQDIKSNVNNRFDIIETKLAQLQVDVSEVKATVRRIEESHQEDVHAMLQTINNKLDQRDAEIQVLNKRIFKLESEVERMTSL